MDLQILVNKWKMTKYVMMDGKWNDKRIVCQHVVHNSKDVNSKDKNVVEEIQNEGTFNQEYLTLFIPKMLQLIKPEKMEMVKNIMNNYKA